MMANIPIFTDEDIIHAYIKDKLSLDFDNFTIEEIIELTKTEKYKDFSISFKIAFNTNQLINFPKSEYFVYDFSNASESQIQKSLSKTYLRKL